MEILVIDNDKTFTSQLKETWSTYGLEVSVESTTKEAIGRLASGKIPGLVLLNRGLPGLPSTAVTRGMRGTPGMKFVPVVVYGSQEVKELASFASQGSAHGFLRLPFDAPQCIGWMHSHRECFQQGISLPAAVAGAAAAPQRPKPADAAPIPPKDPIPPAPTPVSALGHQNLPALAPVSPSSLPSVTPSGKVIPPSVAPGPESLPSKTPSGKLIPPSIAPSPGESPPLFDEVPRMTPSGKPIPDSLPPPRPDAIPSRPAIVPPPGILSPVRNEVPAAPEVPAEAFAPPPPPPLPTPSVAPVGSVAPPPGIVAPPSTLAPAASPEPPPPAPAAPEVAAEPSSVAERVHILIADHDILAFEVAYRMLSAKGFKVTHAPDWDSLLTQFQSGRYAVVLLEVDMPGVEDEHLSIFQDDPNGAIPPRILLYSGLEEMELAKIVVELGASGYVLKGGREDALLEAVANAALGYFREKR